jgi:hypothetical protein
MDANQEGRRSRRRSRSGREDKGRWSSGRKAEIVLRILKGESLDAPSRELKVTAARLAQWRDAFLAAGQGGLKSREQDERDAEIARLRAKVGELTMDAELYEAFFARGVRYGPPLNWSVSTDLQMGEV